jgi:hypothetical protein
MMNILAKLLPAKTAITSDSIRAEIARNDSEVASLQAKLSRAEAAIATLDDAEHVKVIEASAATRRAIDRLNAARTHLEAELPLRAVEEEALARAAADEALRQRAEACRKANTVEAKKLLDEYNTHATRVADVVAKLKDIDSERETINTALRLNPVAEGIASYNQIHRKAADRQASEQKAMRHVWVYSDGSVEQAPLDSDGNPKRPDKKWIHHEQRYITANIEKREIVVGRTSFRPGCSELSLTGNIILPPGFSGGASHWTPKA